MSDPEARVLDAVDLDGLIATLDDLVAFESTDGREVAIQERVAAILEDAGMETDVWEIDLDALARHPAYGAEIERDRALGIVGRIGRGAGSTAGRGAGSTARGAGPTLILNAHVDVVPVGEADRWTVPPWRATVKGGRVYGRGTADTKGGLASAIAAVRALRDAGVEPPGTVLIQSVIGEEDGGTGTLAAIERGHTGDAAIVLEPTELAVAPAQAGALSFRITVPGRAAHGALREEGVDPVEKSAAIHRALRDLERERNERLRHPLFDDYEIPYAICVGKVRAGVWASTVAESVVMEGRLGVGIGEASADARAELEAAVEAVARRDPWLADHPPTVEWWGARFEPAAIDADHPLVETLAGAVEDAAGSRPPVRGMPYGADMHLLVREGKTPTVLFGPGDVRRAHAPDEFVPVAELETAARALALTILRG